jgi:adenylylsulfate kinase-like enzyme
MIYWFIGQPGSGKTTLARALKEWFVRHEIKVLHIDGDDLRAIFNSGYTPEVLTEDYRKDQTRALQRFIGYLSDQDKNVHFIVSTVNGYRDVREEFKKSRTNLCEIYVTKSDLDVRGREGFHIKGYEEPLEDFVYIDTTGKTVKESLEETIDKVVTRNLRLIMGRTSV